VTSPTHSRTRAPGSDSRALCSNSATSSGQCVRLTIRRGTLHPSPSEGGEERGRCRIRAAAVPRCALVNGTDRHLVGSALETYRRCHEPEASRQCWRPDPTVSEVNTR
jgi:hypothetical protein